MDFDPMHVMYIIGYGGLTVRLGANSFLRTWKPSSNNAWCPAGCIFKSVSLTYRHNVKRNDLIRAGWGRVGGGGQCGGIAWERLHTRRHVVWIITSAPLEPFAEKHGVASWREGGSLEISSSQKLCDMIRLTSVGLITSNWCSDIVVLGCSRCASACVPHTWTEKRHAATVARALFPIEAQCETIQISLLSPYAQNNPINPNAFETSTTGRLWPCQAQSKGCNELNTHLCESAVLQFPLGALVNDARELKKDNCVKMWSLTL